jgi:hypothetical protein
MRAGRQRRGPIGMAMGAARRGQTLLGGPQGQRDQRFKRERRLGRAGTRHG